jgi:prepilin-type processing-associated H-X9-DG protein
LSRKWYEPPNDALVSTELKILYCPSNRSGGVIDTAFMEPIAGRPLPKLGPTDYLLSKGANAALCEQCQIPPAGRGAFDVNTKTTFADITDGTTQTIAGGDGSGGNPRFGLRRFYPDTAPATGLFPGQRPYIDQSWCGGPGATTELHTTGLMGGSFLGITAVRGGQADPFDEPMNRRLVLPAFDYNNSCTNTGTTPGGYDTMGGYRSLHPGGCQFLFCDGSVRFIREGLRPDVYRALSTIAGGEVIGDL